jgi:4a-hydroxytetrahydrobiopterin dehydratase
VQKRDNIFGNQSHKEANLAALSPDQVTRQLSEIPQWKVQDDALFRVFSFPDFVAAMLFVNQVAKAAESAGHHPDIDIRYNKVTLALSTHDAGGITDKDFQLAASIDQFE